MTSRSIRPPVLPSLLREPDSTSPFNDHPATGEITIQVGDLIARKQALMLPTNDTGSVIIQKNAENKYLLRNKNSSFRTLPDLLSLFFLLNISRPPRGYARTKKVLHTLPEISPRKIARNKP